MIKYLGDITIGNVKTEIPREDIVKKELESKYNITINDKDYTVVYVPTPKILGSVTYALFAV